MRTALLLSTLLCSLVAAQPVPTYSKEIAPILQAKCQTCHRPGEIAPFTLTTFEDAKPRLRAIKAAIESRQMPPWKPVPGFNSFANSYGLVDVERQLILDWIAADGPEGNKADLPPAPELPTSPWTLGEPDAVLTMPKPFAVTGDADIYRCFVLPYELKQDEFLSAIQVLPGNRSVVHHALLYLDTTGMSALRDGKDGQPGYPCFGGPGEGVDDVLGVWVPGARTNFLPDGVGIPIPSRARLVMQLHYHPGDDHGATVQGKQPVRQHGGGDAGATDQSTVGLYFTRTKPKLELAYAELGNDPFTIPAGATNYVVESEVTLPPFLEVDALVVGPHMHTHGRTIKVEKRKPLPSEEAEPLIYIDNWDFDWQGFYTMEKPMRLEASSRLRVTCTYDNNSPDAVPVSLGESTTDEMCLAYVGVLLPEGTLSQSKVGVRFGRRR